jgi:hypothetical protein
VTRLHKHFDVARIDAHICAAVEAATLADDPYPHMVVNEWLPTDTYQRIIEAIPPPVFFADLDVLAGPVIKRLLQLMPPDRAALWAGAKVDRAAGY